MNRVSAWVTLAFGSLFVAASVWVLVMPKAFASLPDGEAWTYGRLTAAIEAGDVAALALTGDARGDVVVRTEAGGLAVYRATTEPNPGMTDTQHVLGAVMSAGRSEILEAGARDGDLLAFGRAIATIPPPDTTLPMVLWLVSIVAFLGSFMAWLASRTGFRLIQPFGARFGVGTDRSP